MGWNPAKDPGIGYAVERFESKRRELFDDRHEQERETLEVGFNSSMPPGDKWKERLRLKFRQQTEVGKFQNACQADCADARSLGYLIQGKKVALQSRFENQKTRLRSEILQDGPESFADAIVRQAEFGHHELTSTIVFDLKDRFRAKAKKVSRFKAWVWNKADQAITAVIIWVAIGIVASAGILWIWIRGGT